MNWNWGTFGLVLAISGVLRLAGLISDFWMGLAVAAILAVFVALQNLPAGVRKWSTYFLIGWLLFQFGPAVYDTVRNIYDRMVASTQYVGPEIAARRLREDLRLSEALHPSGLSAFDSLKQYADLIEGEEGHRIHMALDSAYVEYTRTHNFQTLSTRVDKIKDRTKGFVGWRDRMREYITTEDTKLNLSQRITNFLGIDARIVFWGLLTVLAAGWALSYILQRPWIRWAALAIFIIIGAGAVVDKLIWGGFIPSGSSAPVQQPVQQQNLIRVQILPNNQLSDWVKLPHRRYTWAAPGDIEFVLPNGRTIKVANGNTNYKLGRVYEFRLRGDPGEAVFTLN